MWYHTQRMRKEIICSKKAHKLIVEVGHEVQTLVVEHTTHQTPEPIYSEPLATTDVEIITMTTKQQRKQTSRKARGSNGKRPKVQKAEQDLRELYKEANRRAK